MNKRLKLALSLRFLLIEATVCLFVSRLIVLLPISYWSRYLGELQAETPVTDSMIDTGQVKRIKRALSVVSRHVPWRSDCLPQALAARMMLGRRKIPTTFYLGVASVRQENGNMLEAHAWLRCGTIMVTGDEARPRFNIISTFAKRT